METLWLFAQVVFGSTGFLAGNLACLLYVVQVSQTFKGTPRGQKLSGWIFVLSTTAMFCVLLYAVICELAAHSDKAIFSVMYALMMAILAILSGRHHRLREKEKLRGNIIVSM